MMQNVRIVEVPPHGWVPPPVKSHFTLIVVKTVFFVKWKLSLLLTCRMMIRCDTIQWLENDIVTFLSQKWRKRKRVFLCSGRGGKTLEKLKARNYTNIQCKASIQSVWTTNADWKLLILLMLPRHDPPLFKATLLAAWHSTHAKNVREWIMNYDCENAST